MLARPARPPRPTPARRWPVAAIGLAALALGACDRSPTAPSASAGPGDLRFALVSGGGVESAACTELAAPVVVQALRDGKPAKGQLVNFVVTRGGGRVYAGAALTDNTGYARDYWSYGAAGPQALAVRAVDPTTGTKLEFATATGSAVARPATITAGPLQWAPYPGDPNFLRVSTSGVVADACGTPMGNVAVTIRAHISPPQYWSNDTVTGPDGRYTATTDVYKGDSYTMVAVLVNDAPTVRQQFSPIVLPTF
jgi:hypothetical protein